MVGQTRGVCEGVHIQSVFELAPLVAAKRVSVPISTPGSSPLCPAARNSRRRLPEGPGPMTNVEIAARAALCLEPARKIGFVSLRCPEALVDSERIITRLRAEGYELALHHSGADVVIVNTCGFLDSAQAESLVISLSQPLA